MDFAEMIALLREPGDTEIPGTIYDDLSSAHTTAVDGASEKIAQVESALADSIAEVARLKALNFDLLMSAASEPENVETDSTTDENISVPSLDTLFERN